MAKKVNKNQRTDRGRNQDHKDMVKLVVAFKKQNGQYSFRQKMVEQSTAKDEVKALQG